MCGGPGYPAVAIAIATNVGTISMAIVDLLASATERWPSPS
jgi:hypothetical protein